MQSLKRTGPLSLWVSLPLSLLAVGITIGWLWFAHRTPLPLQASLQDVQAEAARGGYRLIDTRGLWSMYQERRESLLLVDTRQEWEFRAGHLPGAVNFPMEPTAWSRWRKAGSLEDCLGPDTQRLLVFY